MSRRFVIAFFTVLAACEPPLMGEGDSGAPDGGSTIHRIVSLAISPDMLDVSANPLSTLTCTATFDDNSTADVSGSVTWEATPAGIIDITIVSAADNVVRVDARA